MDAPLWGDTGGHTGAAPTHLHHIFPHIPHKQNNYLHAIHPNETVGAVPACPPERPRSGVSIREIGFVYHALCMGNLTMDAPLWGDTGGHTGTAPTKLRYTFMRNPPSTTPTTHTQSTQTKRVNNLHTHRGRKCIAHSRPHSLKQVVYANWHRDDAHLF